MTVLALLLTACSDTTGPTPWSLGNSGGQGTSTGQQCRQISPADAGSTPAACDLSDTSVPTDQACGTTVYGDPDQFRNSPREHPALEVLALEHADTMTAPSCLYDRLVRDIQFIRRDFIGEEGVDIYYSGPHDGRTIRLEVDAETADAIKAGNYDAWDCLNDYSGKKSHTVRPGVSEGGRVELTFKSTMDVERVANSYTNLPGLVERYGDKVDTPIREGEGYGGRRTDICVSVDGDTYRYVFINRWGDCPAGCAYERRRGYAATLEGEVCKRYDSKTSDRSPPERVSSCGRYAEH